MTLRRVGTDADGWPLFADQFGRSPDEIVEHDDAVIEQAYRLSSRSLMESCAYLNVRQIGVDPDGWPIYGRPF